MSQFVIFCCLLIRLEQKHAKTQKYPTNVNKIITRKNCSNIGRDENEKTTRAIPTVTTSTRRMNEAARSRLREPGGWKNREKMLLAERRQLSHNGRSVVQRILFRFCRRQNFSRIPITIAFIENSSAIKVIIFHSKGDKK